LIARARVRLEAGEDVGLVGLALALVAGAVLRFWDLTSASQHTDEAFSFAVSAMPVPVLLQNVVAHDFHPPLFYLATHYLMVWFPRPQWDYRYLTAACGCLTIVATWVAARRMFGPIAAAVAAVAVALSPALVQYDRIYRMYSVTVALSTLAWALLLELERARGRARVALVTAYGLAAIVLPYVDYLGALMLAAQGAYAFTRVRTLAPALGALAVAALAFLPWAHALREQLPLAGLSLSRPGLDLGLAASIEGAFAAGTPAVWLPGVSGVLVPALALAVVVVAAGWLGRQSALPFWLGVLAVQIGGSIVVGKNLAYFPRYLLIDIPPFCIAVGLIIAQLIALRRRVAAAALGIGLLAFLSVNVSNVLFDRFYQFPDWYAVNSLMLREERPSDAIVLDAAYEALVVRDFTAFRGHETLSFMNPGDFDPILTWIAHHPGRRIWYVEHQNVYWDPQRRIATALAQKRPVRLEQHWPHRRAVDNVSVLLFGEVPMTVR
jgi:4-amino-4-deoxy-L-arabinose transferase-like glycosyltransferase